MVCELRLLLRFVDAHAKQIATEQTELLVLASELVRLFGLLQPVGILGAVEVAIRFRCLVAGVRMRSEMASVSRAAVSAQGTAVRLLEIIRFSWQFAVAAVRITRVVQSGYGGKWKAN